MNSEKRFFEDVQVGDEIPTLVKDPITEVQIVKYAGASGDFNPLHIVHSFGEKAGFGGVIAHGMIIMGFLGQMLTSGLPDGFIKKFGVNFRAVTKPGDTVTCRGKVVNKFLDGKDHCIEIELVAENQRGETPATGKAIAVLPSRASE
jgi:acyl dehydratase